jgi:hypothetical protein
MLDLWTRRTASRWVGSRAGPARTTTIWPTAWTWTVDTIRPVRWSGPSTRGGRRVSRSRIADRSPIDHRSITRRFRAGPGVEVDPWGGHVRLSLSLVQRLYLALSFCRPALSSTHSSLKPQEAHRYLVTRTALKMLRPTGMLLPAP